MLTPGNPNGLIRVGNPDPLDELGRIDRSLRFRASAGVYLSRTFSATGNRKTFVWSGWVKRTQLGGVHQSLLAAASGPSVRLSLGFGIVGGASAIYDAIGIDRDSVGNGVETALRRDPLAWCHVVFGIDTTQATAANRVVAAFNGVPVVGLPTGLYSLNEDTYFNLSGQPTRIGSNTASDTAYFDGYLAHVAYIDGYPTGINQANWSAANLAALFALTHPKTGQWRPRAKSVVKAIVDAGGVNSYFLPFDDPTNLTTLCADASAKGNNWTATNVSLTAGTTYDSMLDTPTSNFCTLNPISMYVPYGGGIDNGGLRWSAGSSTVADQSCFSTFQFPPDQDTYAEFTIDGGANIQPPYWHYLGISELENNQNYAMIKSDGTFLRSGASTAFGTANWNVGDVFGVRITSNSISFYRNGTLIGTPATDLAGKKWQFRLQGYGGLIAANFGQRPFAYTPPSNSKVISTKNLSKSIIARAFNYLSTLLFTGNGTGQSISGLTFTPDLVWIKARSFARSHRIFNSVRGVGKYLVSNSTNGEATDAQTLTAFNNNGFTLGSSIETNNNAESMVAWAFKAGGAPVANNAGSTTSQVSANALAGISLITYTGSGAAATVGHGLGVVPKMIFVKAINGATGWFVYNQYLGVITTTPQQGRLLLNDTGAAATDTTAWNNTLPNASVFSVGANTNTNANASPMIAFAFAEVDGFSKLGYYAGNGSADGPFINCGFRPAFVLIKNIGVIYDWYIYDSGRGPYNTPLPELYPNLSAAEGTGGGREIDFVSSGFKIRNTNQGHNASGNNYIYLAFAEFPFRYANAR